jgi:hypothetical protein
MEDGPERKIIEDLIHHGRYQIAAELLSELRGPKLVEEICRIFSSPKALSSEHPLRALHPGTVITTNYDSTLEDAFSEYRSAGPLQPIESIFSFRPKIVKLHGSVSDPSSIVLNVSSYTRTYNKEFEWFLIHVFQNTTVLFIGTSLNESEPYMRFIRLLSTAQLLNRKHYAFVPFFSEQSKEETDKKVADRSNELESMGIRALPYIVDEPEGHAFVDQFLRELAPKSNNSVARTIKSLSHRQKLFGVENVGPSIFRLNRAIDRSQKAKRPFLDLITKYLRDLREQRRFDLVRNWRSQLEDLVSLHEELTQEAYSAEISQHPNSNKLSEIANNKAFLYDAARP